MKGLPNGGPPSCRLQTPNPEPLMISRSLLWGAAAGVALSASLHAQLPTEVVLSHSERAQLEAELDQSHVELQRLIVPAHTGLSADIAVVIEGEAVTLRVTPHDVRSPNYKLLVQGDDGLLVEAPSSAPTTVRGSVLEWPGSRVAGSLLDGQLDVIVAPGPGLPTYGVQPAKPFLPNLDAEMHAVYSSLDQVAGDWNCATDHRATQDESDHGHEDVGAYNGIFDVQIVEIACDADFQFYQSNGSSVSNTEADILNIISRVEDIYEAQPEILYEVTTIIVRSSSNDPYTSSVPAGLLNQFRQHWNSSQQSVVRDVAHLFTGVNLDGSIIGIASLSVICSQSSGYGLSQSKFSGSIVSRTGLTAHELGHNWSVNHCNGQSDCGIMCSSLGGCTGNLQNFGVSPLAQIVNHKNSRSCLEDAVPPPVPSISSVTPGAVAVLDGELVTLSGAGFKNIANVFINGTPVDEDDVDVIDFNTLQFIPPSANTLGAVNLTVENVTGTSPAAILTYQPVSDVVFRGPQLFGQGLFPPPPAVWEYAGAPGDFMYLLVGLDSTTAFVNGVPVLVTPFKPFLRTLNAAGVGQLVVPWSPSFGPTFPVQSYDLYTQGVFFGPFLKDSSDVVATLIF